MKIYIKISETTPLFLILQMYSFNSIIFNENSTLTHFYQKQQDYNVEE